LIYFRCWYCDRGFSMPPERAGEVLTCSSCRHRLRVPRTTGGNSRSRSLTDFIVEAVVYGGGGALLGFGAGLVPPCQSRVGLIPGRPRLFILGLTLTGFLIGLFGGERGINWLGRLLRERTDR